MLIELSRTYRTTQFTESVRRLARSSESELRGAAHAVLALVSGDFPADPQHAGGLHDWWRTQVAPATEVAFEQLLSSAGRSELASVSAGSDLAVQVDRLEAKRLMLLPAAPDDQKQQAALADTVRRFVTGGQPLATVSSAALGAALRADALLGVPEVADAVDGLPPRLVARVAMVEGELLALRLPGPACSLLRLAHRKFAAAVDDAAAERARILLVLAMARATTPTTGGPPQPDLTAGAIEKRLGDGWQLRRAVADAITDGLPLPPVADPSPELQLVLSHYKRVVPPPTVSPAAVPPVKTADPAVERPVVPPDFASGSRPVAAARPAAGSGAGNAAVVCQKCGTYNPETRRFCRTCGTFLGDPERVVRAPPPLRMRRWRRVAWPLLVLLLGLLAAVFGALAVERGGGTGQTTSQPTPTVDSTATSPVNMPPSTVTTPTGSVSTRTTVGSATPTTPIATAGATSPVTTPPHVGTGPPPSWTSDWMVLALVALAPVALVAGGWLLVRDRRRGTARPAETDRLVLFEQQTAAGYVYTAGTSWWTCLVTVTATEMRIIPRQGGRPGPQDVSLAAGAVRKYQVTPLIGLSRDATDDLTQDMQTQPPQLPVLIYGLRVALSNKSGPPPGARVAWRRPADATPIGYRGPSHLLPKDRRHSSWRPGMPYVLLHLIGEPVSTARGGWRLRVTGAVSEQAQYSRARGKLEGEELLGPDDLQSSRPSLVVLQSEPAEGPPLLLEGLRVRMAAFGLGLHDVGVRWVLVVPPLPDALAAEVVRTIAAAFDVSAPPHPGSVLDLVHRIRELIGLDDPAAGNVLLMCRATAIQPTSQ
jgi:hypothetical protein